MTRLIAALLSLMPALATAQHIDLSAIPDGGQIIHRHDSGVPLGTFTFHHDGSGAYTVDFRKDDRLDGPVDETHFYDASGNMTQVRYASGKSLHYRPHNCARTLGECDYTMLFASGAKRHFRRVGTIGEDGLFESRLYRVEDGEVSFREAWYMRFSSEGLVARAERRDESGKVTWGSGAERLWADSHLKSKYR